MDKLTFVSPNKEMEKEALEFAWEFKKASSPCEGSNGLLRFLDNYDLWLKKIKEDENKEIDDKNVPTKTFFIVRVSDNKIVGISNFRLALNERFRKFGGSLGSSIRPSERQKGYSKLNIFMALNYFNALGVKEILLDCDKANIGSSKSIMALGGKLICEEEIPDLECIKQDFVIDVEDSINKYFEIYDPYVDYGFLPKEDIKRKC